MLLSGSVVNMAHSSEASKPITMQDVMHFESIKKTKLSNLGNTLAYEIAPDRGNSLGVVKNLKSGQVFTVEQGSKPLISHDGRYVAFDRKPDLLTVETSSKKQRKKLKNKMVLLDTVTGAEQVFEQVKSYAFNEDSSYLAIWFEVDSASKNQAADKDETDKKTEKKPSVHKFDQGSKLQLINLESGESHSLADVTAYAMDKSGKHLAIVQNNQPQKLHQVSVININTGESKVAFSRQDKQIGSVDISDNGQWLALTYGDAEATPSGRVYQLRLIDVKAQQARKVASDPNWKLNRYSKVTFSDDSQRLFFGRVPEVNQQLSLKKNCRPLKICLM